MWWNKLDDWIIYIAKCAIIIIIHYDSVLIIQLNFGDI